MGIILLWERIFFQEDQILSSHCYHMKKDFKYIYKKNLDFFFLLIANFSVVTVCQTLTYFYQYEWNKLSLYYPAKSSICAALKFIISVRSSRHNLTYILESFKFNLLFTSANFFVFTLPCWWVKYTCMTKLILKTWRYGGMAEHLWETPLGQLTFPGKIENSIKFFLHMSKRLTYNLS